MTTIDTLTDSQIRALSTEAGEHGDTQQVAICDRALDGDAAARAAVVQAINYAESQATGLTPTQDRALPCSVRWSTPTSGRTEIDHADHADSADDCAECAAVLASLRRALPTGWTAEWTGDGNGTASDVAVEYEEE